MILNNGDEPECCDLRSIRIEWRDGTRPQWMKPRQKDYGLEGPGWYLLYDEICCRELLSITYVKIQFCPNCGVNLDEFHDALQG